MRLYFAIIFIALNSALGFGQAAEFSIDKPIHKFPKTYEGTQLEHVYRFSNTGEAPLLFNGYKVECSCTKVILPQKPVLPGESGEIKVMFDTKGKYFFQDRIIELSTNAKKKNPTLRFKVKVIPRAE